MVQTMRIYQIHMIVFVWVQLQRLSIQWCSGSTLGERCKVAVGSIVDDVSNYFNTWVVEAFTFDWLCTGASEGSSHELVSQSWAYWLWSGARSNKIDRCLWCLKGHHAQHKTWTSQDKGTLRERCDATTPFLVNPTPLSPWDLAPDFRPCYQIAEMTLLLLASSLKKLLHIISAKCNVVESSCRKDALNVCI